MQVIKKKKKKKKKEKKRKNKIRSKERFPQKVLEHFFLFIRSIRILLRKINGVIQTKP